MVDFAKGILCLIFDSKNTKKQELQYTIEK